MSFVGPISSGPIASPLVVVVSLESGDLDDYSLNSWCWLLLFSLDSLCMAQFLLLLLVVVVHVIVVVVAVQFYFDSCNPAVNIVVNCNSASRCRDAPPFGRE